MNRAIKFGLYFVISFSVLAFGAAEVWAVSIIQFVVFLLFIVMVVLYNGRIHRFSVHFFQQGVPSLFFTRESVIWIPVALFTLLILFQLIPLPGGVLKVLSPATYNLYLETGIWDQGVGFEHQWRTISINTHKTFRMLLKLLAYMGIFMIIFYYHNSNNKKNRVSNLSSQSGNEHNRKNNSPREYKGTAIVLPNQFIVSLVWTIFFLGVFNTFFFFLQQTSMGHIQWLLPLAPPGIHLGTFKSPNNFSEFLEMAVPLAMSLLIAQHYHDMKRMPLINGSRVIWISALFSRSGLISFGIIVMVSALLLSLSKGGLVTFSITMIAVLLFMFMSYRLRNKQVFALFVFVLAGSFCYLVWLGVGPIIKESRYFFMALGPQGRIVVYRDAINIIADFPLFGIGFGCWKDIILKYHSMIGREIWMPRIAYNDTLQLAAETGLAGLSCIIAFLFIIYRKAIIALKHGTDVFVQALILGGLAAMTAALIHSQFDYLFILPSNALAFSAIAGMTYRLSCEILVKAVTP